MDEYLGNFAVRMLENENALLSGKIKVSVPLSLLCFLHENLTDAGYGDDDARLHAKLRAVQSLLGKCRKVKLVNGRSLLLTTDIARFFPALVYLELCHIDIQQLRGVGELRNYLQVLVVVDSFCDKLAALLDRSIGDASMQFSASCSLQRNTTKNVSSLRNSANSHQNDCWKLLKALFFVRCGLEQLDDSLQLCPALDALNLRRNELTTCGECLLPLASLSSLDISYNCLIRFPSLATSARLTIQTLVLRHNYLDDDSIMPALATLSNLRYLDLAWNLITQITSLRCLKRFRFLRVLLLEGNPLCATKLSTADKGVAFDYRVAVAACTYMPNVNLLEIDGKSLNRAEMREANSLILPEADESDPFLFYAGDGDNDTLNDFDNDSDLDPAIINATTPLCFNNIEYDPIQTKFHFARNESSDFNLPEQFVTSTSGSNLITQSMRPVEDNEPLQPELFDSDSRATVPTVVKRFSCPITGKLMAPARRPPSSVAMGSVPRVATIVDRDEENENTLEKTLEKLRKAQNFSDRRSAANFPENPVKPKADFTYNTTAKASAVITQQGENLKSGEKIHPSHIPSPSADSAVHEPVESLSSENLTVTQKIPNTSINDAGDHVVIKLKPDADESAPFHVVVLEPSDLPAFNSILAQQLQTSSRGTSDDKNQLELFVTVSSRHLAERTLNGCVVELLDLDALVDVKQDADNERRVLIRLNYQRRDRQVRHYLVESEDSAFELVCLLEPWLVTNKAATFHGDSALNATGLLSTSLGNNQLMGSADGDVASSVQKCMRCSLSFDRDRAKRKYERSTNNADSASRSIPNVREVLVCPRCGSSQLTEVFTTDDDAANVTSKSSRAKRAVGNIFARRGRFFNDKPADSSNNKNKTMGKPPLSSQRPSSAASLLSSVINPPGSSSIEVKKSHVDSPQDAGSFSSARAKEHAPLKRLIVPTNNNNEVIAEEAESTSSTADGGGTATESEVSLLTNPSESDVRILDDDNELNGSASLDEQEEIENDESKPICMSTASSATVVMPVFESSAAVVKNFVGGRQNSSTASLTVISDDVGNARENRLAPATVTRSASVVMKSSVLDINRTALAENTTSSSAETLADPDEILSRTFVRLREACNDSAIIHDTEIENDKIKFYPDEPSETDPRLLKFIKSFVFGVKSDKLQSNHEQCIAVSKCDMMCEPLLYADLLRGRTVAPGNNNEQRRSSSIMTKSDLILKPARGSDWMTSSVSTSLIKNSTASTYADSTSTSSSVNYNTDATSAVGLNDVVVVFSTLRVYVLRMVNQSSTEQEKVAASSLTGDVENDAQYLSAYNIANELELLGSWPLSVVQEKHGVDTVTAVMERSLKGQCLMLKLPVTNHTETRRWRKKRASQTPPAFRCGLMMIADQKRCARLVNALTNFSVPVNENLGSIFSSSTPISDKNYHSMCLKSAILRAHATTHDAEKDIDGNVLFMTVCKSQLFPNAAHSWSCLAITATHVVLIKRANQLIGRNLFAFAFGASSDDASDVTNEDKLCSDLANMPSSLLKVKVQYEITDITFSEVSPLKMTIGFDCDEQFSPQAESNSSSSVIRSPNSENCTSERSWSLQFATVDTMEAVVGVIRTNCERIYQAELPVELVHKN